MRLIPRPLRYALCAFAVISLWIAGCQHAPDRSAVAASSQQTSPSGATREMRVLPQGVGWQIEEQLARLRAERGRRSTLDAVPAPPPGTAAVESLVGVTKFDLLEGRVHAEQFEALNRRMRDVAYTIRDYAAEVEAELGRFESFNVLEAGTPLPITTNGVELPAGSHTADTTCDRPIWLGIPGGLQCAPFARIGILPSSNPQVRWVFIARRYTIRQNPDEPVFEDVAVIGYHRLTGRTAFFQMLDRSGKDARRVPSPMEPAASTPAGFLTADQFWLTPAQTASIGCNTCHDAGPFIHSPYVAQVTVTSAGSTRPLVPTFPMGKYDFIGSQAFTSWPKPSYLNPEGNVCVTCHRMGSRNGTKQFTAWSTGTPAPRTSSMFSAYPLSHWMPLDEAHHITEAEWETDYRPSANQILACIANPTHSACRLTPLHR